MPAVAKARSISILQGVLNCPTAPFREERVIDHLRLFTRARRSLRLKSDRLGNQFIHYKRGRRPNKAPLLVLAAHMDHPGFIAGPPNRRGQTTALFLGGVHRRYFRGSRVRFFDADREISGRVLSLTENEHREKACVIETAQPVPEGALGMWDLKPFRQTGQRIHSRAIDDLAGCGAVLAFLDHCDRHHLPGEVMAIFTRGEEAGLNGATGLALRREIPRDRSRVITVETSKELATARVGDGPIVRVGDRALIFDGPITYFLGKVAAGLTKRVKAFRVQRRLMDGGVCESTTFGAHGYRTGAVCVALGNYHNMGADGKVREEYINANDFVNLITFFVEMLARQDEIDLGYAEVKARMGRSFERYRPRMIT